MISSLSGPGAGVRMTVPSPQTPGQPAGVQRTAEPPALKADSWDKVSAGKGQVSQSQLASVIVTLSPEGSRLSEAEAKPAAKQLLCPRAPNSWTWRNSGKYSDREKIKTSSSA